MQNWLNYLSANPLLAVAVAIILILFVFMVLRKLIKWAIVSFVILAIVVGLTYNSSQKSEVAQEIEKRAEKVIQKSKEGAQKLLDKGKEELEKAAEKKIDDLK